MKEKATIYDLWRVCKVNMGYCKDCPLQHKGCDVNRNLSLEEVDELNEAILEWCKEHPVKTRQNKFLELFPNASTRDTIIDICPCKVDCDYDCKNIRGHCGEFDCGECKKSYWLAEVEE